MSGRSSPLIPRVSPRVRRVAGALALVGGVFAVGRWAWQSPDATPAPLPRAAPAFEIEKLRSFVVRDADGRKSWELSAERVVASADRQRLTAHDVDNGTLYRDGKPWVRLKAPLVRVNSFTRELEASGGVKANGPKTLAFSSPVVRWNERSRQLFCPQPAQTRLRDWKFEAPQLHYDTKTGVISSPQPVVLRGEGAVLRAPKLRAHVQKRTLELGGGAELVFNPNRINLPELPKLASESESSNSASSDTWAVQIASNSRDVSGVSPLMRSRLLLSAALLAPPAVWLSSTTPTSFSRPNVVLAQASNSRVTPGEIVIRNSPQGGRTVYNDATGIAVITKDVVITQGGQDLVLYAQRVTHNRIKNQARATGDLRVETRDATIKAQELFADFNTKTLTFTGSVVISAHGKNDGVSAGLRGELQRKPVRIAANRADWDYETKQGTLSGNIRIVQDGSSGTCERIFYDEARNVVELQGNARFQDEKNRRLVGRDILIYVDQNIVETKNATRTIIPNESRTNTPGAAPTPTKQRRDFDPASSISEEDLKVFDRPPAPLPPLAKPTPEADEAPEPAASPTPTNAS